MLSTAILSFSTSSPGPNGVAGIGINIFPCKTANRRSSYSDENR
jgi:hypothetical protein